MSYNLMMKNLYFKESIKNFLFDLNNFITVYDNFLHIFNYEKLVKLSEKEIIVNLDNKKVKIEGFDLLVEKMNKQELLIRGTILKVEFSYE